MPQKQSLVLYNSECYFLFLVLHVLNYFSKYLVVPPSISVLGFYHYIFVPLRICLGGRQEGVCLHLCIFFPGGY